MSKTFKSADSPLDMGVGVSATGDVQVSLGAIAAVTITPSDAPALALAILESAGHGGSSDSSLLMQAFDLIELHVKEQERITAEAKDKAELEAEALELFRASQCIRTDGMYASVPSFAQLSDPSKTKWLAVARRAREINKEEK